MSETDFWNIVDRTVAGNAAQQLNLLNNEMKKLPPESILAFHRTFTIVHQRAYTWDLWGAGYVINGGMSDDGFDYFRSWLISRGRKTFELALKHADDLADALEGDEDGEPTEFEEFMDPARNVWGGKTGKDLNAYFQALGPAPNCANTPAGTEFDEDEAHLAARYPKLWARFGKNPRG